MMFKVLNVTSKFAFFGLWMVHRMIEMRVKGTLK